MMHGRHLHHAHAVGQRSTCQIISLLQRGFSLSVKVLAEVVRVPIDQVEALDGHDDPPWYRTTSTSASSVAFRERARIRSAICCAGLFMMRYSWKLSRMPSVARIKVSSSRTGSVAADNLDSPTPTIPLRCNRNSRSRGWLPGHRI